MRLFLIAMALLLALAGLAGAAQDTIIYDGDAETDSGGLSLGSWGSGFVAESYDVHYVGPHVLRVLSQGYYQGGVLTFKRPLPLADYLSDPNAYLEFMVKPAIIPQAPEPSLIVGIGRVGGAAATRGTAAATPRATQAATPGGARPGGGGVPGRFGGGGGMRGNPGAAQTRPQPTTPTGRRQTTGAAAPAAPDKPTFSLRRFRVFLVTDRGEMIVDSWPITSGALVNEGWRKVDIPLAAFKSVSPEHGTTLKAIRLFADRADVFFVGQIRLLVDDTPLRVKVNATPASTQVGSRVAFAADVTAGNSDTVISWDFDQSNGIQVDAQGQRVEWIFSRPGQYVVTCRVADLYGSKEPATSTATVNVSSVLSP